MTTLAAYIACFILAALALFQAALIVGAPIGHLAWGGAHKVLPANLKAGSVVSIVLYGVFAAFILTRAELLNVIPSASVVTVGMWAITAYFMLGTVMNAISKSRLERAVMTPVAGMLALLSLIVAL